MTLVEPSPPQALPKMDIFNADTPANNKDINIKNALTALFREKNAPSYVQGTTSYIFNGL